MGPLEHFRTVSPAEKLSAALGMAHAATMHLPRCAQLKLAQLALLDLGDAVKRIVGGEKNLTGWDGGGSRDPSTTLRAARTLFGEGCNALGVARGDRDVGEDAFGTLEAIFASAGQRDNVRPFARPDLRPTVEFAAVRPEPPTDGE